jgi:hypothetical protein
MTGRSPAPPADPRRALNGAFLSALARDFEVNGAAAIAELRATNPGRYLDVIAGLQKTRGEPEPAEPPPPLDTAALERQVMAELDAVFGPARTAPRRSFRKASR